MQESVTRAEFERLLNKVYAPKDSAKGVIDVSDDVASIVRDINRPDRLTVRFARDPASVRPVKRFWRAHIEFPAAPADRPLTGMRIALDPGHLGGNWSRMEGRWFQIGDSKPVCEGDLTLQTAEHLATRLTALGAEVLWVRRSAEPATPMRPTDFYALARELLLTRGITNPPLTYSSYDDPQRGQTVQNEAELIFYRTSEIRYRARLVNETLHPDLVLCLHYNAEPWGNDAKPDFVPRNHFHILVNGAYSAAELHFDDNRYEMLLRLFGGVTDEEQRIATRMAEVFARESALPPYTYPGGNAVPVNDNPYVWARNLLANRLYRCPVVFLEPYVMNSQEVWERVQAGDYEGERLVAGSMRKSLTREYADAVADGLAAAMK
jgi:hypothetical protein